MLKTDAAKIVAMVLENDDSDDVKEVSQPPRHVTGVNDSLMDVLIKMGISADRIHNRYSDTYVMCRTWEEANAVVKAGSWKSMAQVARTNPGHPDAKAFPWLADIPFANLSGYMSDKTTSEF